MFKSQLQEFVQKAGFLQPVYESCKEGPSHKPMFKATVCINGNIYESPPGLATVKAAQNAAAKAALDALLQSGCETGVVPSPVHESGLCKNILQEHAHKSNLSVPIYRTVSCGREKSPTFMTTVDIGGMSYSGGPAKNKKESEIKAARTALIALQTQSYSSGLTLIPLPDFSQGQLGSSNVMNSSLPRSGKRGRDPKDGTDKISSWKVKKEPLDKIFPDSEMKHEIIQDTHENGIQHEADPSICQENNTKHQLTEENESQANVLPLTSGSSL